jgi:hypothetical protein
MLLDNIDILNLEQRKYKYKLRVDCVFCGYHETIDHLFISYSFTCLIWGVVYFTYNIPPPSGKASRKILGSERLHRNMYILKGVFKKIVRSADPTANTQLCHCLLPLMSTTSLGIG